MCKHPAILAPFNGFSVLISSTRDNKPGISASASSISFSPHFANEMSFIL